MSFGVSVTLVREKWYIHINFGWIGPPNKLTPNKLTLLHAGRQRVPFG